MNPRTRTRNSPVALSARLVLLALIFVVGCAARPLSEAGPNGRPPTGANMEEVRHQTGLPNAMRFLSSGEEVWEFNDGRVDWGAWRVVFERDGRVREVVPIRTPEDVARLKVGETTTLEALDWLGEPTNVSFAGQDPVWEYRRPFGERLLVRFGPGKRVKDVSYATGIQKNMSSDNELRFMCPRCLKFPGAWT